MGHAERPDLWDCKACDKRTKEKRRCLDDRLDFTESDDNAVFPIRTRKGGAGFGFCPAKANWRPWIGNIYNMLIIVAETGTMPFDGPLSEQPQETLDLLSWFIRIYRHAKFVNYAKMVFGSKEDKGQDPAAAHRKLQQYAVANRRASGGNNHRRPRSSRNR